MMNLNHGTNMLSFVFFSIAKLVASFGHLFPFKYLTDRMSSFTGLIFLERTKMKQLKKKEKRKEELMY